MHVYGLYWLPALEGVTLLYRMTDYMQYKPLIFAELSGDNFLSGGTSGIAWGTKGEYLLDPNTSLTTSAICFRKGKLTI